MRLITRALYDCFELICLGSFVALILCFA